MSNELFPTFPGLEWGIDRDWEWRNASRDSESGRGFKRAIWNTPRRHYKLSFEFLRADSGEVQQLVGFFNRHKGNFDTFLFEDPIDKEVALQFIGTASGSAISWPTVRTFGGHDELVTEYVGAPVLYADTGSGPVVLAGATFSQGSATATAAPAAGALIYWSGQYRWRCEFSDSRMTVREFMQSLHQAKSVSIRTYKP